MEIGLFFGSFNPVHIGHLALAEYMLENTILEQVWFVVSPHNPLKVKETLLDGNHRLEMVHLAVDEDKRFRVCDIEFRMPRPSFTIDTLIRLSEKYPSHSFSLIMGEDNLDSFHKWKNASLIAEKYHRYVYPRHNTSADDPGKHKNITLVNAPRIEISSSLLRRMMMEGKSVRYFLPAAVYEYLERTGYYTK
jgi:nicotinate-nucleotide adenylyltransferase